MDPRKIETVKNWGKLEKKKTSKDFLGSQTSTEDLYKTSQKLRNH